ncbi:hypothetical protein TWF481_010323 [Arthrobotrys musiformis]|uniref:Nucleoside phosphorylase domain-containing protein n=1 Tax=Arthrobotrys musiformis TaxID=47236 RepID=A0AAV9W2B9_9PEZI
MAARGAHNQRSFDDYMIGWVCGLPKEQTAAVAMLDERHGSFPQPSGDENNYILGSIGAHNIVITCLPMGIPGLVSASSVSTHMFRSFLNIKFCLLVGTASGIPNGEKVRLGDVVVGTPKDGFPSVAPWEWGMGSRPSRTRRSRTLADPPSFVLAALDRLQAAHGAGESNVSLYLNEMINRDPTLTRYMRSDWFEDILFNPTYAHRVAVGRRGYGNGEEEEEGGGCRDCDRTQIVRRRARGMRVHYGLIASASIVVKDAELRDNLNASLQGKALCLCLEMEAAGVLNNLPCLVIRGISNYADSHKNDVWQEHSAAAAAAFAKDLLGYLSARDVYRADTAQVVMHAQARR